MELTAKDNSISNQVIRGDLEFVKIADGSQNRLANVPFKITSKTTGESHVIVTDANGYASTSSKWNKHTANTNRGESSKTASGSAPPNRMIPKALSFTILTLWRNSVVIPTKAWIF